jgi:hypothetical protein
MSPAVSNTAFTIGYIVVIVLVLLAFIWAWRRTHGEVSAEPRAPDDNTTSSTPPEFPYIRGTDLYRRSLAHGNDTEQERLAMGLPPQHNESMWRDPPG